MFATLARLTGNNLAQTTATDHTSFLCTEVKQRIIAFVALRDAAALLRVNHDWRAAVTSRVPLHGQLTKAGRPVRPYEKLQGCAREGTPVELRDSLLTLRRWQLQRERGHCAVYSIDFGSPEDNMLPICFSSDARLAIVGGVCRGTQVWSLESGRIRSQPFGARTATARTAALSPGGQQMAVSFVHEGLSLYRLEGETPVLHKTFKSNHVWQSLLFSPDGRTLLSRDSWGAIACCNLYDVDAALEPFFAGAGQVCAWAFSDDSRRLAASMSDLTVRIFDTEACAPQLIASIDFHPAATTLQFSQDNAYLVTVAADNLTRLFDLAQPTKPRLVFDNKDSGHVRLARFIDDDRVLLTVGTNGTVHTCTWATSPRKAVRIVDGCPVGVAFADVSPDKLSLVTLSHYSHYDIVNLWNLADPAPKARSWRFKDETLDSATFSDDGQFIMAQRTWKPNRVYIFDFNIVPANIRAPSSNTPESASAPSSNMSETISPPAPWWYRLLG